MRSSNQITPEDEWLKQFQLMFNPFCDGFGTSLTSSLGTAKLQEPNSLVDSKIDITAPTVRALPVDGYLKLTVACDVFGKLLHLLLGRNDDGVAAVRSICNWVISL